MYPQHMNALQSSMSYELYVSSEDLQQLSPDDEPIRLPCFLNRSEQGEEALCPSLSRSTLT